MNENKGIGVAGQVLSRLSFLIFLVSLTDIQTKT